MSSGKISSLCFTWWWRPSFFFCTSRAFSTSFDLLNASSVKMLKTRKYRWIAALAARYELLLYSTPAFSLPALKPTRKTDKKCPRFCSRRVGTGGEAGVADELKSTWLALKFASWLDSSLVVMARHKAVSTGGPSVRLLVPSWWEVNPRNTSVLGSERVFVDVDRQDEGQSAPCVFDSMWAFQPVRFRARLSWLSAPTPASPVSLFLLVESTSQKISFSSRSWAEHVAKLNPIQGRGGGGHNFLKYLKDTSSYRVETFWLLK